MIKQNAIAVFDIGKTNKKLLLFNEQYQIVFEQSAQFDEIKDEDGFPCEDILALTEWIERSLNLVMNLEYADVKAINFSAYGASFVHVDKECRPIAPLYNYLKPFPEELIQEFYTAYGGEINFSQITASPVLGNLNSGLQLWRLKYEQSGLFNQISCSLHLPQYLSSIITKKNYSDITSIGCHTALWDFRKNRYHDWVYKENIIGKLAPVFPSDAAIQAPWGKHILLVGIGMHDSSAALIPYLLNFTDPFILLSTGTWNISLNPFNQAKLTEDELNKDCLCYMDYRGKQVKASRLFAGYEHEEQTKSLGDHFHVSSDYYRTIAFDASIISKLSPINDKISSGRGPAMRKASEFAQRTLSDFSDYETAYHQLMLDIIFQQILSTNLVLQNSNAKRIFVDGGFSRSLVFMNLLALYFPQLEVYGATLAHASALGAALAIHQYWNDKAMVGDMIQLKLFSSKLDSVL
jgi:L-fuculokinase